MGGSVSREALLWLDYLVFVLVLFVSIGIGSAVAYVKRKRNPTRTLEDYYMSNR